MDVLMTKSLDGYYEYYLIEWMSEQVLSQSTVVLASFHPHSIEKKKKKNG
jgi:hypothetical protein